MKRLRLIVDTNVFLVSLSPKGKYHWLYQCILQNRFDLCVSTEIILEYEEIISSRYKISQVDSDLNFLLKLPNVYLIEPTFRWNLVGDVDDNKFVDCYVTSNSDYLVANDGVYKSLAQVHFPNVVWLKYDEFEIRFKASLTNGLTW